MFKGASGFHAGAGGSPPIGTGGIYGGDGTVPTEVTATITDNLTFKSQYGYVSFISGDGGYWGLRMWPGGYTTGAGSSPGLYFLNQGMIRRYTANNSIAIGYSTTCYVSINKTGYYFQSLDAGLHVAAPAATMAALKLVGGSATIASSALIIENSIGTETFRVLDDGAVGVNQATPDASALFDVVSTDKGFLPPRNTDPNTNIATPAAGLLAYDSTDNELQYYNGTSWISITGGIYGGSGTVPTSVVATLTDTLTFASGDVVMGTSANLLIGDNYLKFNDFDVYDDAGVLTFEDTAGGGEFYFSADGGNTEYTMTAGVFSCSGDGEISLDVSTSDALLSYLNANGSAFQGDLGSLVLTAARTWRLPDTSGTLVASTGFTTLIDAATITWDYLDGSNARVILGASRILDTPSNVSAGDYGTLKVEQDGTGGWGLTLPATFEVVDGGGSAITLTATAGAVDIICWVYDGAQFWVTYGLNFT